MGVRIFNDSGFKANVFIDADNDFVQDAGEPPMTRFTYKADVEPTTTTCDGIHWGIDAVTAAANSCSYSAASSECYVFFNSSGEAVSPTTNAPINQGDPVDFELFIFNGNLDPPSITKKLRSYEPVWSVLLNRATQEMQLAPCQLQGAQNHRDQVTLVYTSQYLQVFHHPRICNY